MSTSSFRRTALATAVAFAVTAIALLAASEWLVRAYVVPNDTNVAHLDLLFVPSTPNAIFGDSHTLRIVGLPGFVNLSRGGESVRTTEAKVRRFFESQSPGKLVLHADPNQFTAGYPDEDDETEPPPFERSAPALYVLSTDYRGFLLDYWKRLPSGTGFETSLTLHDDGAITTNNVWPETYPSQAQQRRIAESTVANHQPVENIATSPSGIAYRRLVGFLTDRGADLCLVVMPHTSAYLEATATRPTFAEAHAFVRQMADDFGVTLIDLTPDFTDQSLFADEDHLNERGGRIAASLIEERCFESQP